MAKHTLTALAALSLLTGCAAELPTLPIGLKDTKRPDVPAATVRNDITIAPPVVIGGTEADNRRLSLALENALRDAGYDVRNGGPWRIVGAVNAATLTWTIVNPDGSPKGRITQTNLTTPALRAVVPGVQSHLPRPSTPL